MAFRFRAWLVNRDFDMMHLEQMRNVIKRSRELLASIPVPDTFLGRKTREPPPQGEEGIHMEKRMASTELEPPE